MFKQTWWNDNLKNRYNEYLTWLGDKNASSKIYARNFIKINNIKSMIDFGCGPCIEYLALIEEQYDLKYLGVDSCIHLKDILVNKNIPFLLSDIEETNIADNSYELSYSRHVCEHLQTYKKLLAEMIRISNKVVLNIFFIIPGDEEKISFCKEENLYHNTYNKKDIESFLTMENIYYFAWERINDKEIALIIDK